MRSWFERRLASEPAASVDEAGRLPRDGMPVDRAVSEAYDRGRREERLRHRGSPLLAFLTIVLVCMALAVLVLALKTGSFANAGAVLDNFIQRPVHAAADNAGSALEDAGQTIKNTAGTGQP